MLRDYTLPILCDIPSFLILCHVRCMCIESKNRYIELCQRCHIHSATSFSNSNMYPSAVRKIMMTTCSTWFITIERTLLLMAKGLMLDKIMSMFILWIYKQNKMMLKEREEERKKEKTQTPKKITFVVWIYTSCLYQDQHA